jgi:hypothetical protein
MTSGEKCADVFGAFKAPIKVPPCVSGMRNVDGRLPVVTYHLGFVSSAIELHYRTHFAFEVMWTPYGVETNLCRGLAKNAYEGETVTLQPCGSFPRTIWIVGNNIFPADARCAHRQAVAHHPVLRRQRTDHRGKRQPERAVHPDRRWQHLR